MENLPIRSAWFCRFLSSFSYLTTPSTSYAVVSCFFIFCISFFKVDVLIWASRKSSSWNLMSWSFLIFHVIKISKIMNSTSSDNFQAVFALYSVLNVILSSEWFPEVLHEVFDWLLEFAQLLRYQKLRHIHCRPLWNYTVIKLHNSFCHVVEFHIP